MQRARRLALLAVLAVVGTFALAGCRTQPDVAAYVGDKQYTDAAVEQIVDSVRGQITEGATGNARQAIVADEIFVDLAKRYADEHNYGTPNLDVSGTAAQYGLQPDNAWVKLSAEVDAYRHLLLSRAESVTPSDADLRDIYNRAVAAGLADPNGFSALKSQLAQVNGVAQAVAVRRELTAAARRYHVAVNPHYQPSEFSLLQLGVQGQSFSAVALPFGKASTATAAVVPAPAESTNQGPSNG